MCDSIPTYSTAHRSRCEAKMRSTVGRGTRALLLALASSLNIVHRPGQTAFRLASRQGGRQGEEVKRAPLQYGATGHELWNCIVV